MTTWRKAALALAGAATAALAAPRQTAAQGGAVYCLNCGVEATQWLNYLQLVGQLQKQTEMLRLSLLNARPLAQFPLGGGLSGIRELNGILSQAQSLTYAAGAIDPQFSQKFKDFNGYSAVPRLDAQFLANKRQQWSMESNDATKTTLNAVARQNQQIQGAEEQTLQALQAQAASVQGDRQAQQTAMALTVETIRQLQKLRQLVMVEIQQNTNRNQIDADREAATKAQWTQMATPSKTSLTGGGKTFRGGE